MTVLLQDVLHRAYSKQERDKLVHFGGVMRGHRAQLEGHSLRATAGLLGMSPSALSAIERGLVMPSAHAMKAMAALYDFDEAEAWRYLPKRAVRGRKAGTADPDDKDKWGHGRRLFAELLKAYAERSGKTKLEVAMDSKMSLFYVRECMAGRHPIPPNSVCIRLAKAVGMKPLKFLILRAVACAHPGLRAALLKVLMPSADGGEWGEYSDDLMNWMMKLGWKRHV